MFCKSCGCEIKLWETMINVLIPGSLYPVAYHLDCGGCFLTSKEKRKQKGVRLFSLSLFDRK